MIKYLYFGLVLILCSKASATDVRQLTPVEQVTVSSEHFDKPMTFNVTLPASYGSEPDKRYFVMFDLHPRSQPYLSGTQDWLSHNGDWPWLETIIITPADYHQEFAQLFISTTENPEDKSLLNFLDKQILTYIDKQYRTNGFRIYSGFMGNAAFGLYALLNQPTLFNAYFLASPSIQDDFLGVNSTALNKLEALTDKQRFVYINIGEHNYEKGSIEAVKAFENALQAKAPTQLQWQINFADSSHYMSRPIVTVIAGIERLFWDYHTPLAPDSDVSKQGVQAIIDYYRALSANKYGFEVSAESSLSALAKHKLADEPKQSIKIYQLITQLYPDSAYAFANLASAYANGGDLDEAIKLQTKAIDLSKVMVPWHQKNIEKKLREYERQLGSVNSESP